jgi:hypothetical protein
MNNLIRIQGKVIEVKPAKTGYYITVKTVEKWQRAFSQWRLKEGDYSLTLRQDNDYFFIVSYQMLKVKVGNIEPVKQDVYQPYEKKDEHIQQQLIQEYQTKIHQLQAEVQQWKNAYYNQKWMLKKAQELSQQRTVETKIKALESKPGKKSKQDLDYLQLLTEFNGECKENWAWLNSD